MASITLRLLIALNASMMIAKRMEIIKWTTNRVRLADCAFSFSTPKMSMQKEVVRAVKAESALLNAAAMIPIVKKIRIECPNMPEVQNIGRISSFNAGSSICCCDASVSNRTPSERNKKLTGVKAKPYSFVRLSNSCRKGFSASCLDRGRSLRW